MLKILLVDDSELMRTVMKRNIQLEMLDVVLFEAEDGVQALEMIELHKPDFVLSDSNMPNMSGIQLLEELRKRGNTVPFGFFTTQALPQFIQKARSFGVAFIHPKPFSPAQLALDIENAVDEANQ